MTTPWNQIYLQSSENMVQIPNNCVSLIVCSPPYNVGIQYSTHNDAMSQEDYLAFLERVWRECWRTLAPWGRMAINVANVGRSPYFPLSDKISQQMADIGFKQRGEIIWLKGASTGNSTAWGSWRSPSNPSLRDIHEFILIFSKTDYKNPKPVGVESDLTAEEFTAYTKSVWEIPTVSAKKIGHPAPFPEELPHRLIKLYTWPGQVVLDPFCGSGQTCLAAHKLGRQYVGYDVDPTYVELAKSRLPTDPREEINFLLKRVKTISGVEGWIQP